MAHKKGQGSSRNGRDSNSQRLGVKRSRRQPRHGWFHPRPAARPQVRRRPERRPRQGRHAVREGDRDREVRRSRRARPVHHRSFRPPRPSSLPRPAGWPSPPADGPAADTLSHVRRRSRHRQVRRRRRQRLHELPPREVRAARRSRRRRRRLGRLGLPGRRPHHNTLVNYRFHPEFKARARRQRRGLEPHRAERRGPGIEVPPGTVVYDSGDEHGERRSLADLDRRRRPRAGRARRPRRPRQRGFAIVDQSGAAPERAGRAGRSRSCGCS